MVNSKIEKFLITILFSVTLGIIPLLHLQIQLVYGVEMDVKCAVYENSDEENGNNVDVRVLAIGLNGNDDYTVEVSPDHNLPKTVTAKTDYEGILWTVVKIPNGEKSLFFNVNLYKGYGINENLIIAGNDDAPCYPISSYSNN